MVETLAQWMAVAGGILVVVGLCQTTNVRSRSVVPKVNSFLPYWMIGWPLLVIAGWLLSRE